MLTSLLPSAEEAVTSFLETITGEDVPLEVEDPSTVEHDELEEHFEGRFAVLGRAGGSEPFVGLFDHEWLPYLSEAMLGEAIEEWSEEAEELVEEAATQLYASIRNQLSAEDVELEDADFTVVGDAAGLPSDLLGNRFEAIDLRIEEETERTALILIPSSAFIEDEAEASDESVPSPDPDPGAAGGAEADATGGKPSQAGGGQGEEPGWPDEMTEADSTSPGPTPADEIDPSHEEEDEKISVSSPSFPDFDEGPNRGGGSQGDLSSMELLGDVEIELSVELGRRSMPLEDILRLTNGSIVELDKLAGEPLQIYANNRLVAEGEAVVIDDQFGIRITRLASTEKRARALM